MRTSVSTTIAVLALACQRPSAQHAANAGPDSAKRGTAPVAASAMPDVPAASSGALRLLSAGPDPLNATLPAHAGLCDGPGVLLLQGTGDGLGLLVVLALPPEGRVTRYPVSYSVGGAARLPTPPAAQMALQHVTARAVLAYQALEGNVEVYGFGSKVSGRFQVSMRELATNDIARVAGVFADIPIAPQPAEYCRKLADSVPATSPAGH